MDGAVARVREEAAAEGLRIIGLVNNAGVSNNAPLEFLPMAKLRQLLETNVVGPAYLTQLLSKDLRAAQGRVVQISSVLGVVTMATRGAYSASKHALEVSAGSTGLTDLSVWLIASFDCYLCYRLLSFP